MKSSHCCRVSCFDEIVTTAMNAILNSERSGGCPLCLLFSHRRLRLWCLMFGLKLQVLAWLKGDLAAITLAYSISDSTKRLFESLFIDGKQFGTRRDITTPFQAAR